MESSMAPCFDTVPEPSAGGQILISIVNMQSGQLSSQSCEAGACLLDLDGIQDEDNQN